VSLGLPRPCLDCGEPSTESRCEEHGPVHDATRARDRATPEERGYDAAWRRLSARARARQNFCTRCQSTDNLSTDHLPSAWWRKAKGLPLSLRDVQVLCATCQAELGSSRPGSRRYAEWEESRRKPIPSGHRAYLAWKTS